MAEEKDHDCFEEADELDIRNSVENSRVKADATCQRCGENIVVHFVLDQYEDENGDFHTLYP